jgi:uncharacterized membrane protein
VGGSHSHVRRDDAPSVELSRGPVTALLVLLALCAVATVVGVVALWPDSGAVSKLQDKAQFAAPGVTFQKARVTTVQKACPDGQETEDPSCGHLKTTLTSGPEKGDPAVVGVPSAVSKSGVSAGDTVRLMRVPAQAGNAPSYSFDDVVRLKPLWLLGALFVLVVALVARVRGLLALVSLGLGGVVLFRFMLRAVLSGSDGLSVEIVWCAAIMFVVL